MGDEATDGEIGGGETDRKKKSSFWCSIKKGRVKGCKETKRLKRMRSADKMVRSQALWNADSGRRHFNLRLPFHIDSSTFVHLSQFRFNISFSKFRWLIPLCIWFSSISMILQHQDINLVPFIMLPGNQSELNLVRWKDINKNKKNKNHYLPLLMQNSGILRLRDFKDSQWYSSNMLLFIKGQIHGSIAHINVLK